MVKKLTDICLACIAANLDSMNGNARNLPALYKEILIELLANHDMLTMQYLPYVTYNLFSPVLKRIVFYRCDQVTDHLLINLAYSRCKLRELTIKACPNVTDIGIQAVTQDQTDLIYFKMRKLIGITGKAFVELRSKELKVLKVKECSGVTSEGIKMAVINNPNIKELNISLCTKMDESIFPVIANALQENLEEFVAQDIHSVVDDSLVALADNCPNLRKLHILGGNKVTQNGMEKVFLSCKNLQDLDVSYCSKLQNKPDCDVLQTLPVSITSLSLCGVLLSDEKLLVESLKRLLNLKVVKLCGVTALTDATLHEILSSLGENLKTLDLSGCRTITDEGLKAIPAYCKSLEEIILTQVKNVTVEPLIPFFQHKDYGSQMKSIALSCSNVSEDVLHCVATNCHNVEFLDISGHHFVTDNLVLCIAENCAHLHEFYLKGCKLVTDKAICELSRCCPLKTLSLSGLHCATDKSVIALANNCHYLKWLFLSGCSLVTKCAIRYLLDCCIPRVFVMHKVPNAPPNQLVAKNLDTGEYCRVEFED